MAACRLWPGFNFGWPTNYAFGSTTMTNSQPESKTGYLLQSQKQLSVTLLSMTNSDLVISYICIYNSNCSMNCVKSIKLPYNRKANNGIQHKHQITSSNASLNPIHHRLLPPSGLPSWTITSTGWLGAKFKKKRVTWPSPRQLGASVSF